MTPRVCVRFLIALSMAIAASDVTLASSADHVITTLTENWRWSRYWFGEIGIDDVYVEGKKIAAVVFWNDSLTQPVIGICSLDLLLCVAHSSIYLDPSSRRMSITSNITAQQAFQSFAANGFRDSSHSLRIADVGPSDFHLEEQSLTLPVLTPPSSIINRQVAPEALQEAKRIAPLIACARNSAVRQDVGCSGRLVFGYYGSRDPYWFVLRECSSSCAFKGETILELRRGDRGWEVSSGGVIDRPKSEVDRLKTQIQKAEMFHLQL
jgi:hypothetical protein